MLVPIHTPPVDPVPRTQLDPTYSFLAIAVPPDMVIAPPAVELVASVTLKYDVPPVEFIDQRYPAL